MELKRKDNVVRLRHNSNISITEEAVTEFRKQLRSIIKIVDNAISKHTASHGDEYYFKDEVNEKESCDALGRVEFGVYRRPNPYEKKSFARDTETDLNKVSFELSKICEDQIHDIFKDPEDKNEQ